jgi:hypothetical protein
MFSIMTLAAHSILMLAARITLLGIVTNELSEFGHANQTGLPPSSMP